MEGTVKAAVMIGKKKMEWCEREIPQPGSGKLQTKLEYIGVCGSNLHPYSEGRLASWVPDGPLVLEHEPGGVVSAIGKGVAGFEIGDRVVLESGVLRGHYEDCLKRYYNFYGSVRFMVIPGKKDGVPSEYCTHAASVTFELPDNVSTMEDDLTEPLAAGMHACELSNAKLGETAVVLGVRCIGLVTLMFSKARGANEIYVAGVLDRRLEKAKELGAIRVFNSRSESIEEFVKALPGSGVDQVYECARNRITTLQTYRLIKRIGKITFMGVSPEPVLELDIATLNAVEGTIYSVYRYRDLYPPVISAVSKGPISLKKTVSHAFDFKGVIKGMDYSLNYRDEVIKAVIRI